ncbi:PIN domain-containing protein [Nesterenkonia ebinurensis]|uniref:PIN domain-containing protein n=1 Tax=Nesterenkonia ebinurensis TaxID=2608252 RepID=UPI00123DE558|nr:PIN domain-containing protein [Nesterenkonia ebinurensis]
MSTLYIPDVNVLLPLLNPEHEGNARAHAWLESVERFATTPVTESGTIRLLMNPATGDRTFAEAVDLVQGLFTDARVQFLPDTGTLRKARVNLSQVRGFRQVTDFQLINLAVTHNAVLATYDSKILEALVSSDRRYVDVIP